MSEKIAGENVQFFIEIEDKPKKILLVLDRKCDYAIVPWQDAFRLAEAMEDIAKSVNKEFKSQPRLTVLSEQAQVRLNFHLGLVAILVEWTDRISFTSLEAFMLVARAIRKTAQDSNLSLKGVHFQYDKEGMIAKIINSKSGITQHVR